MSEFHGAKFRRSRLLSTPMVSRRAKVVGSFSKRIMRFKPETIPHHLPNIIGQSSSHVRTIASKAPPRCSPIVTFASLSGRVVGRGPV